MTALPMTWRRARGAAVLVLALTLPLTQPFAPCQAAEPQADYVYTIVQGDTLIGLSARLLHTPVDWPKVARHNRLPNPNYLLPGARLRVPFALLKTTSAMATVTHVHGEVRAVSAAHSAPGASAAPAAPAVLALGASLAEGTQVTTGKDGHVTLKLQDGSTVRVQSESQMQMERMRTYAGVGVFESAMRLIAGRLEALVRRPGDKTQTRHSVTTPLATLAARGTEFRVTMDARNNQTRGEVLDGVVGVGAGSAPAAKDEKQLHAGFGSVVDAAKNVSDPIKLLDAPDVSKLAKLQERTLLRFALAAQAGARTYRAQLARDAAFNGVIAELVSVSPELRIANIADGAYFLRVRAIDGRGFEGRDATHAFTLKARPEPPLISAPAARGKVRASAVEFQCAENTEAATYHLQVAKDASFKVLVHENSAVKGAQAVASQLALGEYFWRVASLRRDGDRGPYGDAASFVLMAPPAHPEPAQIGDNDVKFRWAGEAGQQFAFQVARDQQFTQPLLTRTLDKPEIAVPRPARGVYFMRYRATDADGFVGPFSSVQKFTVPVPPPVPTCLMDTAGRCVSATHGVVAPGQ